MRIYKWSGRKCVLCLKRQRIFCANEGRKNVRNGIMRILPYQKDVVAIDAKAKKVIRLVKNGAKLAPTSPDVMVIFN